MCVSNGGVLLSQQIVTMEDLITDNDNTLRAPGIQVEIVNIQTYLCQRGFNRQSTKHNDAEHLEPQQQMAWTANSPCTLLQDEANITGDQMCLAVKTKPLDIDDKNTITISDKFTVYNNPHDDHTDYENNPAPSQACIDTRTSENSLQVEYQSYLQSHPKVFQRDFADSLTRQNNLTDDKQYKCEICEKVFKHSHSLKSHRRIHTGDKLYQCKICQKDFIWVSHLNQHKRIHTGEKPFQCDVCQKCFRHSSSFAMHKRTHTGEKPFRCEVCEKCFTRADTFNEHKRIHTGEKPYQCDICHKCFTQTNHLKEHKRLHTGEKPFLCDVCQKYFRTLSAVIIHKRIHTGEKPFQCDVCQKCFTQSYDLTRHKRIHKGDKPFQSHVCQK